MNDKKLRERLVEAYEHSLEMANIPPSCRDSASISYAAYTSRPQCWVIVDLKTGEAKAVDLRRGREADEK